MKKAIFGKEPDRIFKITNYSHTNVILDGMNREVKAGKSNNELDQLVEIPE